MTDEGEDPVTTQPVRRTKGPHRYPGMTLEQRAAARRTDLIKAGCAVMARDGVAGLKVRDVCQLAGLNERYFYESFSNPAALARAVANDTAARFILPITVAMFSESDATARIKSGLSEGVRLLDENPDMGRILLLETMRGSPELSIVRESLMIGVANVLLAMLDPSRGVDLNMVGQWVLEFQQGRVIGAELADPGDPRAIAVAGALAEVLMAWTDKRLVMPREQMASFLFRMLEALLEIKP